MLEYALHSYDIGGDPMPNVASDAEIEIAEQLRHKLEERYLGRFAAPPPLPTRSNERSS